MPDNTEISDVPEVRIRAEFSCEGPYDEDFYSALMTHIFSFGGRDISITPLGNDGEEGA